MRKLFLMLVFSSLAFVASAQTQTEDEVYIDRKLSAGKTFGDYRSTDTKPIAGRLLVNGAVVGICKKDCCNRGSNTCSLLIQLSDSSVMPVSFVNSDFKVTKRILGQNISVEGSGKNQVLPIRQRTDVNNDRRKDIPFSATGLKIL